MAKKNQDNARKVGNTKINCDKWIQDMEAKYPLSAKHLLAMLENNGFKTFGHAVSQLSKSFETIETFLNKNLVLILKDDALKSHKLFMEAVETALQKSEEQLAEMVL